MYSEIIMEYVTNYNAYLTESNRIYERIDMRNAQIKRLEKKREKLQCPRWTETILKPIAEALTREYFPNRTFDILGPFGLCSRASIHFYKKGIPEAELWDDPNNCLSITFEPIALQDGVLGIVDYSTKTADYPLGSIGEVNGMNYSSIPLSKNFTLAELKDYINEEE